MELLCCPACHGSLWDPVTVSCGHSFCKGCLGGQEAPSHCPACQQPLHYLGVHEVRCNVLLGGLLDKCLDGATKVARLRSDLHKLSLAGDYPAALRAAQRAIEMAPQDFSLRMARGEVHVALKQYRQALEDLNVACRMELDGPEGSCRNRTFLSLVVARIEALRCLFLNSNVSEALNEMGQVLPPEVSPLPDTVGRLLRSLAQYVELKYRSEEVLTEPLNATSMEDAARTPASQSAAGEPAGGDVGAPHIAPQSDLPQLSTTSREPTKRKDPEREQDSAEERSSRRFKSKDAGRGNLEESTPLTCAALRDLLSPADFECSLCVRMFFEPVTTPCGHTFCKECLERCLDHRPCCPLCKQSLREYLKDGTYTPTVALQEIMAATFPVELSERTLVQELDMATLSNLTTGVPIFICTMAFPSIACPLHIFEPRYRLMMRRCQETGTKSFGMCIYERGKSFADFGCMLEILRLEYLADGRSLVDTVGKRRFRVLRRGHRDGYHTADVEYLEDTKVEGEALLELQRLHDLTYQQVESWIAEDRADLARPSFQQSGPLPQMEADMQASPDGPAWCWWLLSILPLDPRYQTMILSMTSLKERLTHMKHTLSVFTQSPA